jgi:glycosyltransferase involved in cell wall biosynthesis
LNILQINGQLSRGGGPQTYMQQATNLLSAHGHRVSHFGMWDEEHRNDPNARYYVSPMVILEAAQADGLGEKLGGALRALWFQEASTKLAGLLDSRPPELAHLHNIRYELSPAILPTLKKKGLPVVQTVHDYALLCPRGCFYSEAIGVCEKCRVYRYFSAPFARCIKGSLVRSSFAAGELALHRAMGVHKRNIDLFIVPSQFMARQYLDYGFPAERVYFLRNAVRVEDFEGQRLAKDAGYCAYVGALRKLKGVRTLLDAAQRLPFIPMLIVGDGEERGFLELAIAERGLTHVKLYGHLSGSELRNVVAGARFTIVPSEWYENCPMVVLESFALGRPAIGAHIGGIPEMIEDHLTGLLFESGNANDLADKMDYLFARPDLAHELGAEGRRRVEELYGSEAHYEGLMDAYALAGRMANDRRT